MTREEALEILSDGHTVFAVEIAHQVCDALGTKFPARCVLKWEDAGQAELKYGIYTNKPGRGEGVHMTELGMLLCQYYGLTPNQYIGKGSRAREYVRCIKDHLETNAFTWEVGATVYYKNGVAPLTIEDRRTSSHGLSEYFVAMASFRRRWARQAELSATLPETVVE